MTFRTAFPRVGLFLAGAVLTLVGLGMGLSPEGALGLPPARIAQMGLAHTTATTHIRVAFGGLHLGVGLFAILCAFRHELLRPGLIGAAIVLGCVVVFRLTGIALDATSVENLVSLAREGGVFALVSASLVVQLLPAPRASSANGESGLARGLGVMPRYVLAALFIFAGVTGWFGLVTGAEPFNPPMSPAMQTFVDPLMAFAPFWAFLKTTQLAGGLALLVRRTAPLGALVLAPVVAVIAMSQILLNPPQGIGIGLAITGLEAWTIWLCRDQYRNLIPALSQG